MCRRQTLVCGGCEGHDPTKARWAGEHPGSAECRARGWYCRDLHLDGSVPTPANPMRFGPGNMRWHVPCGPDDEGASADLNRWHRAGCPSP